MIIIIKRVLSILDKDQKNIILKIQLSNLIVSIFEIITLGSLAIFIGLLASDENIFENKYLIIFYDYFKFSNKFEFMFFLGACVLSLYIFTGILNIVVTWKTNLMSSTINQYLSNLIIKNYVFKDWQEYTKLKISDINKDIFTDLTILSNSVIVPLFNLFNKVFIAISLLLTLIIYNYKVALLGALIYSVVYFFLLIFVKKINSKVTKNISINRKKNHAFIHNFFSGFKEVIIFNLRNSYFEKIKKNNFGMIYPTSFLLSLTQIPRFFVELISYIVVISGILLLIKTGENLDNLLPMVAVYAFAGLKLLPAFQQIYLAYVRIKAGQTAMNNLYPKIIKAKKENFISKIEKTNKKLNFKKDIKLKKVSFSYDESSKKPSIKNINLNIKKNTIVGLAGPSGGGKSTIVDIICGLLTPKNGTILVDGKILNRNNLRKWQNNFGVVTQMPFLSGDKIVDNISFSKIKGKIDYKKLEDLIEKVELKKFIRNQKKGLNSNISDRGINISGGERQRIAIARSLYFGNDIIIFDEATNALDKITENKIINFIKKLRKIKTVIIITHRTNTLKVCDNIFVIKDGSIIQSGKYERLKNNSKFFKTLISES